uniref:Uncharacterized protein n=1 Tax=Entomoneis paludosa TaxID=265537 RepID=A0A7S2Y8X8_9STRA|mmetsp:Transcript_22819/g.47605  ORF Transcript_22819/g.47605 Transcript_22819/m.47605 type:complete len:281 (+) Transcript_22819:36-878(+)
MPRFRDEWVIDRVLFDFVSGGSCSCCGLQHFLPNGTADLIGAISDLDTDQQKSEVAALAFHPWPPELRDQVWADRVRLRQKLKMDKKRYQEIWQDETQKQNFLAWCRTPETFRNFRRWFQLARTEVMETIQQKYNIHSAFGVVLCAVIEQVAGFPLTEYPPDGRGSVEIDYEGILTYDRRGGFTLPLVQEDGETLMEENLEIWLTELQNIGSPGKQLLQRGISSAKKDGGHEDDEDGDADGPTKDAAKTSFASDRRIIRLIIARIWADLLQEKFREQQTP